MRVLNVWTGAKAFLRPGIPRRKLLMAVLGVTGSGVSVGFLKQAAFGTDPFQCFCNGLNNALPIGFGTLYVLINLVLLALVFLLDRHSIGIATFINLFLLGYVVEFSQQALFRLAGPPTILMRVAFVAVGIVALCFASAMYFTADLGVSTYDAVALYLARRGVGSFRIVRICTDCICVLVGYLLGYVPGVCTVVTAFFMGPLIAFFNDHCAKPILYGKHPKRGAF